MAISEVHDEGEVPIKLWTPSIEVELAAMTQLHNVAKLPWVFHHVAVMPDCHFGYGATVGSVIAMKGAVSPAAVGVDIGCGMGAIRTNLSPSDLPDNLKALRLELERRIPVGFNAHDVSVVKASNDLFREYDQLHRGVQDLQDKARKQVGTLGGGNHFIELCVEEASDCTRCCELGWVDDGRGIGGAATCPHCDGTGIIKPRVWLMLHSGSRNIGKCLAEIHMTAAKKLAHNADLPDPDLAVFLAGTQGMEDYRHDLYWAQRYAFLNRQSMFEIYKDVLRKFVGKAKFENPILCHHNYVSEETHYGEELIVTRKGAINAARGIMGIIPGSMGTKSYIVEGLGADESFHSASHGAGRRMSRGKAKRTYTLDDMIEQTQGVECRKTEDVLDEIPGAYKDIDQVMANQTDLVKIKHVLKQVLCVKG